MYSTTLLITFLDIGSLNSLLIPCCTSLLWISFNLFNLNEQLMSLLEIREDITFFHTVLPTSPRRVFLNLSHQIKHCEIHHLHLVNTLEVFHVYSCKRWAYQSLFGQSIRTCIYKIRHTVLKKNLFFANSLVINKHAFFVEDNVTCTNTTNSP